MSHKASMACAGAFAAAASLAGISPAFSHTIVGDRVFPATLTIDDPGENDEFVMPSFAYTAAANPDGTLGPLTYGFDWEYSKTITYNLAFSVGSSFIHQVNPSANSWSNIETQLKYGLYQNAEHEFIVSVAGSVEWGNTGTGFNNPNLASPPDTVTSLTAKAYVGKGFGDVEAEWVKPFAVTGEIDYNWSTQPISFSFDPVSGLVESQTPTLLTYGATIQYSLLYMNSFVHEVPEFFRQLVPTFEAIFTSPVSNIGPSVLGAFPGTHETTGTYGPALYYFGRIGPVVYQAGISAQIPINLASGKHVGALAVVDFLLDDMFPDSIGKPLFGPPQPRGKTGY
jgi:hypothetical protein